MLDRDRLAECRRTHGLSKAGLGEYVDSAAEDALQPKLQPRQVEKCPSWIERNEEIDVAPDLFVASSDRSG